MYLDLDHLANLRILACGKNRMKSLRIKNLSKIEKVSLIGSKDTLELTLSNLPKLDSLKFNTIPLTVSNIRQIRLLGKHSLSHLICNDLQLGELIIEDMSTLKSINCHGNQLGELVLNNPNLLEEINLSNNKFENFELPFIPLLKHLNFNDNELFELKLLSCPTIENLRCRRNNISEIDIRNLSKLKYLDLAYNKLNFFEINHNALSICRLGNNNLDSIGIKSAQSLKSLWVDDNIFEELHLPSIPTLELLHCGSNQIINLNCNQLRKV